MGRHLRSSEAAHPDFRLDLILRHEIAHSSGSRASLTAATTLGAPIAFALSSAAWVTATVANLAARPIRTLARDRSCQAGRQTLLWDRRPAPSHLWRGEPRCRAPVGQAG